MPPLPKPNTGAAKGARRPSTGTREREARSESSSAPGATSPRSRTTKASVTREQLARMYMMIGTMVMPFGRFYPVLAPVGENLRALSDEAADAWMELAAKDKRVMEILESIVGASTWGNVIGIHLAIFASALPRGGYIQQVTDASSDMDAELRRQGEAMGLSDEEIEEAKRQMHGQPMPVRDTSTGGPGDTIRTGGEPVAAPVTGVSRSAIVTAEELGATNADQEGLFPHDPAPPNGRG